MPLISVMVTQQDARILELAHALACLVREAHVSPAERIASMDIAHELLRLEEKQAAAST